MSGPEDTPAAMPAVESSESAEKPRGALFVVWNRSDDTFLIELRNEKSKHFKNMWNFLGEGKEDIDVDIEATAIRGVEEECGFILDRSELVPLMERLHKQPHTEGSVKVFIIEIENGSRVKEKPEGERENAKIDFVPMEQIERLIAERKFGFGHEAFLGELKEYVAKAKARGKS